MGSLNVIDRVGNSRINVVYCVLIFSTMNDTDSQFESIIKICRDIFIKKTKDYGTAWRVMRTTSVTDQIFIKAQRIRTIQELGNQKIDDDIRSEFIGIVNYSIIGLIQLQFSNEKRIEIPSEEIELLYNKYYQLARMLMKDKNHDYGEAWRDMRLSSLVDLLLMKIYRVKQIEDNQGSTLISEGVDANYLDMINYAIFALIRIEESSRTKSY